MADDGEKETPIEETVKHPEHIGETEATPAPITPPDKAHDDLRDTVDGLVEKVSELSGQVMALTPSVSQDTRPTKKPWTHWGNR